MSKFIVSSFVAAVIALGLTLIFGILSTFMDGVGCLAGASFIIFVVMAVCCIVGIAIDMARGY